MTDAIDLDEELLYPEEVNIDQAIAEMRKRKELIYSLLIISVFILVSSYLLTVVDLYRQNYVAQVYFTLVKASQFILVSVGLTLSIRVKKFANFAHAELLTVGLYTVVAINDLNLNLFFNNLLSLLFFAFIMGGLIAILSELLVFGPLAKRKATPLSLMVASIGVGLIIRHVIQQFLPGGGVPVIMVLPLPSFWLSIGNFLLTVPLVGSFLASPFNDITTFGIFGSSKTLTVSNIGVISILSMVIMVLTLQFLFKKTYLGISMRATSDDEDLSEISGINTQSITYWTWFISGGITAFGGVLLFSSGAVVPFAGFSQLLIIFAVVILGGFDSFEGTLISGFIIAGIQTLTIMINGIIANNVPPGSPLSYTVFWNPSADWSNVGPFLMIIVVLIFRPRGIFGLVDPGSKL